MSKKKRVDLEPIKNSRKVFFLKDYFRQHLALEVVMCHKILKTVELLIHVFSQIIFTATKILDFRKRIESGRIFPACLNDMKECNF